MTVFLVLILSAVLIGLVILYMLIVRSELVSPEDMFVGDLISVSKELEAAYGAGESDVREALPVESDDEEDEDIEEEPEEYRPMFMDEGSGELIDDEELDEIEESPQDLEPLPWDA